MIEQRSLTGPGPGEIAVSVEAVAVKLFEEVSRAQRDVLEARAVGRWAGR